MRRFFSGRGFFSLSTIYIYLAQILIRLLILVYFPRVTRVQTSEVDYEERRPDSRAKS
jgi:hypothetical protein